MAPHDRTAPQDVEAAGRALADRLKREAWVELASLLDIRDTLAEDVAAA